MPFWNIPFRAVARTLAKILIAMKQVADLGTLFFPKYCSSCNRNLMHYEKAICMHCLTHLPRLNMHDDADNAVEKLFWGRVQLEAATAFLNMPRNGITHRLIHRLKYHDDKEVGERLGALFAHELLESDRLRDVELIVPVPLHPKKLHVRGYNQCDCIAQGIADTLGIEVSHNNLTRTHFTASQTRRGRVSRWSNVKDIFWVREPEKFEGKHVLLIDDVITTGATIEACAMALRKVPGIRLSVGALAIPGS
jgi:ComF family protein